MATSDELKTKDFVVVTDVASGRVEGVIAPNGLQVGLSDDDFRSAAIYYGPVTAHVGITGSITQLPDGSDYLQAGSNVTITNNPDGSISIASTGGASIEDGLTLGSGLTPYGTEYDGSSEVTATVLAADSTITVATTGIRVSSVPGTLTSGNGIATLSYDGSSSLTVEVDVASNGALSFASGELYVNPNTATTSSAAADDSLIIYDTSAGATRKIALQQIANLANAGFAGSTTYALTDGNGITDFSFNGGTDSVTVSVEAADSTISVSTSGVAVASVPNSLTHGDGISSLSYDGSSATTVSIDLKSGTALSFSSGELQWDTSGLSTGTAASTDKVPVLRADTSVENITLSSIADLIGQQPDSDWTDSGSVLVTTSSVSIAGGLGINYPASSAGADIFMFVSGTVGSLGGGTAGAAMFGGDVKIGGALVVNTNLLVVDQANSRVGIGDTSPDHTLDVAGNIGIQDNGYLNFGDTDGASGYGIRAIGGALSFKNNAGFWNSLTQADVDAEYLVLTATSSLNNERALNISTGLKGTDSGAGSNYTLTVDNSIVATLTGSQFSGNVGITGSVGVTNEITALAGFTGSLTKLPDGTAYIRSGNSKFFVETGSSGQISLWATDTTYTAGNGLDLSGTEFTADLKSGGGLKIDSTEIAADDSVLAMLTGSQFSGNVGVTGSLGAIAGLSGSLTRLTDGEAYLRSGDNVTLVTGSDGSITISAQAGSGGGIADGNAKYLVLEATGSLTAERVFTAGLGIQTVDAGAGGAYTVKIKDNIVATLTGSQFSGNVGVTGSISATIGLSGSLTKLTDGTSYLVAGSGISISSASNGQVTITGNIGDITGVTAGTGLIGGGTSGNVTLNVDDSVVATLSGSQFSGNVGITGSLGVSVGPVFIGLQRNEIWDDDSDRALLQVGNADNSIADSRKGGIIQLVRYDSIIAKDGFLGAIKFTGTDGSSTTGEKGGAVVQGSADNSYNTDTKSGKLEFLTTPASSVTPIKRMTIGSTGVISIDSSEVSYDDANFWVSGSIGSRNSTDKGTAVFGGDAIVSGSLGVATGISGSLTTLIDGTSYLIAGSNTTIATGSSGAITISSAGGIDGSGASNRIATWSNSNTLTSDADLTWNGTTLYVSSAGITLNVQGDANLNGTVVINQSGADEDFRVETQNKSSALQVDGGTDQVLLFSGSLSDAAGYGSSAADPNPRSFTDTNFFVSGSIGSRATATRGTSVFGGDTFVSGTLFVQTGLSGSLTHLSDGTSYLIAGSGISIASASNGAVTITGNVGDITGVTAGTGLTGGGTSGTVTLNIDNSTVATLTGSQFSGNVGITGSLGVTSGLSGSLTHLTDGTSYLVAGNNIQISTGSSGAVTITGTSTGDITSVVAGTGLTGGGASGDVTLNIDDSVTATLSGSQFYGNVGITGSLGVTQAITSPAISGSLTHLSDGTSYIVAGNNIQIATGSSGAITITGTGTGDITSIVAGTGLTGGGSSGDVTLNVDNSVVATLTGSQFSGNVGITGSLGVSVGLDVAGGTSFSSAGINIGTVGYVDVDFNADALDIDALGTVAIDSLGGLINIGTNDNDFNISIGTAGARIVTLGNTTAAQVRLKAGAAYGIALDSPGGVISLNADGSPPASAGADVNFFVSGSVGSSTTAIRGTSVFGGDAVISGSLASVMGLSGSLTQLADGTSYIRAGNNITVTSASNGAITITSTGGGGTGDGDSAATYLVLSATSSLSNERVFTSGLGIQTVDAGAGGAYTIKVKNNIVATLTGSQFSGNVGITGSLGVTGGISGSLTQLTDGTSYLKAGTNISITSASNGAVTITASGVAPGAGGSDTQVQFNDSDALNGNANFTFDKTTSVLSVTNLSGSLTKLTDGTSYIRAGNSISIVSASAGYITIDSAPTKVVYGITGSHASGSPLRVSGVNFASNDFDFNKTDIYLNGTLMMSGSSNDYRLKGNAQDIIFNFGLQADDILMIKLI